MQAIKWDDRRQHIDKLSHKDKVRFALFCAKQVIHLTTAPEAKEAIRVVELWLEGKATTAANAAYAAANAAYAAAYAAANAAASAYAAADDAANAAYAAAYAAANAAAAAAYAVYYADEGTNAAANAAAYADEGTNAAANAAEGANIKQAQMKYLYELAYINEIVEQQLLGAQ